MAVWVACALPTLVRAAEPELDPNVVAALLLRVLTQDQNFDAWADKKVVLAIVHKADAADSQKSRKNMGAAFRTLSDSIELHGKHVTVTEVAVSGDASAALARARASVAFITPGLGGELDGVLAAARAHKLPTLTHERALVAKGVTVGISAKGNKPIILINFASASAIGMRFDARLLRIAEVYR